MKHRGTQYKSDGTPKAFVLTLKPTEVAAIYTVVGHIQSNQLEDALVGIDPTDLFNLVSDLGNLGNIDYEGGWSDLVHSKFQKWIPVNNKQAIRDFTVIRTQDWAVMFVGQTMRFQGHSIELNTIIREANGAPFRLTERYSDAFDAMLDDAGEFPSDFTLAKAEAVGRSGIENVAVSVTLTEVES